MFIVQSWNSSDMNLYWKFAIATNKSRKYFNVLEERQQYF